MQNIRACNFAGTWAWSTLFPTHGTTSKDRPSAKRTRPGAGTGGWPITEMRSSDAGGRGDCDGGLVEHIHVPDVRASPRPKQGQVVAVWGRVLCRDRMVRELQVSVPSPSSVERDRYDERCWTSCGSCGIIGAHGTIARDLAFSSPNEISWSLAWIAWSSLVGQFEVAVARRSGA